MSENFDKKIASIVRKELKNENYDDDSWLKAFKKAQGDEQKAKVYYIDLRTIDLKNQAEKEKKAEAKKKEKEKAKAEEEKQTRLIDNEIQKLIRLAIVESNKNNNSANFSLTPEGRLISTNFQANKGRLPWPVKEGVIIRRFGTQPHPVVRTTTINSNGISLATSPNSVAYSVFDGEVLSVYGFSGGNPGVLIRHGKYISNYQNLSSIFVKKGDKINANDEIGIVFTNESTGKTVLKFNIFNELKPENPTIWLDKY